jgi:hypothetical protein
MNLSDDLTPTTDPAPLLRAVRRRRHLRLATRAGLSAAAIILAAIGLWPGPASQRPKAARTTPAGPPPLAAVPPAASALPPVTMTRDELIDSLKDETFALIRWPDGREQLLIRR